MQTKRHYSLIDKILIEANNSLSTLVSHVKANRPNPAEKTCQQESLSTKQKRQSAGYMRVNHCGEVCAQALYRGHAIVARSPVVKATLVHCGNEELDHLAWCHDRLAELDSHRSLLNGFWYWSSFMIGALAGMAGDEWSLGFVEETEKQVSNHLQKHLNALPINDQKSRVIIEQMKMDEEQHGQTAKESGAKPLPILIKKVMALQAKVMTTTAYWI